MIVFMAMLQMAGIESVKAVVILAIAGLKNMSTVFQLFVLYLLGHREGEDCVVQGQ